MKFSTVVEHVLDLLQHQGRVSYRMLKREFDLDDELLADLKEELLYGTLAQGYAQDSQAEDGLRVVAEALAMVEKNGERWNEAELYRIKGELLLTQESQKSKVKGQKSKIETEPRSLTPDPQAEAEACFLKAIAIAQQQQAKSLELRAVMSLARLWQSQGKTADARQMLADIYGWFTEGFDTKDLQEAEVVLKELDH